MKTLAVILLSLILTVNVYAGANDDPTLTRVVLDNGMVVILKEKRDVPMVTMQMWVKAGSITEGKYMGAGLSHYIEHMIFKGTKKRKGDDFPNDIRKAGGSDLNAYTSYDKTVYHYTIRKKYFDLGLDAIADAIQNSVFDKEATEEENTVILKEMNMRNDDPDRLIWQLYNSTSYTHHPLRHPIIGYHSIFKLMGRKQLVDYYNMMYSPNNMIFVVVGDFKTNIALTKIKKAFQNFKRRRLPVINLPKEPKQTATRKVVKEFGIRTTKVLMGYPTVDILSDDVAPLDVLALIMGQGETSRLYQKLKDETQLVNSVGVWSDTPKYRGNFYIILNLDKKNTSHVFKVIDRQINKIKNEGVNEKELKRAKQKVHVYSVSKLQSIEGYARSLASGEFIGNMHFDKLYVDNIKKVTNEDIIRVAKKYLNKRTLTIAMLVPNMGKKKASLAKIPAKVKKGKVKVIKYKNGLTVILKQDTSLPLVGISAVFTGGFGYENKKNQGIFKLLTNMLLKGTKKYSARQIAEMIEDTGGDLGARSGSNFLTIEGSFLKHDFKKGFHILLDILANSQFPNKELKKVKKLTLARIKQQNDDIWNASRFHLRRIRFKNHPYGFTSMGTNNSIININRKDLIKLYKNIITPDNLVLAICGDINKDEIKKLLKRKNSFAKRKLKLAKKQILPQLIETVKDTFYMKEKRRQSIISILFDAPDYYSDEKYPFMLMENVFSGIGSRLFVDMREKRRLAYAIGGYYWPRVDSGQFLFFIATEPSKREEAINGLIENIQNIKKELITERELEIAINSTIAPIINSLQTLSGQAMQYAMNLKRNVSIYNHLLVMKKLQKVKREDIKKLAAKYFDLNRYALSVVESKKKAVKNP